MSQERQQRKSRYRGPKARTRRSAIVALGLMGCVGGCDPGADRARGPDVELEPRDPPVIWFFKVQVPERAVEAALEVGSQVQGIVCVRMELAPFPSSDGSVIFADSPFATQSFDRPPDEEVRAALARLDASPPRGIERLWETRREDAVRLCLDAFDQCTPSVPCKEAFGVELSLVSPARQRVVVRSTVRAEVAGVEAAALSPTIDIDRRRHRGAR